MARQADCGRDRLQTLPRHWNGVERQTQDILVGVSLYVCVCVPVSGCLSISLAVSVCLSVYVCFPGCFSTLRVVWQRLNMPHSDVVLHGVSCLPFSPPFPLPPASCHGIKFKIVTFDCQLRLLTNIAMIVAMTCGLECNDISWRIHFIVQINKNSK